MLIGPSSIGYNNFVHRSLPIGWEIGNDGERFSIGIILFNPKNLILDVNFNIKSLGQNSISINPYEPNIDYKKKSIYVIIHYTIMLKPQERFYHIQKRIDKLFKFRKSK